MIRRRSQSRSHEALSRRKRTNESTIMTIRTATPYLILGGKADRGIALYTRALGAKTESLQRFGDMDESCPAARKDLVMHAALRVGEALIMMSDGPGEGEPTPGLGVSVALDFDDAAQMRKSFAALAEGGTTVQAIFDAPWGALFGVVRDELGIDWMFTCPK